MSDRDPSFSRQGILNLGKDRPLKRVHFGFLWSRANNAKDTDATLQGMAVPPQAGNTILMRFCAALEKPHHVRTLLHLIQVYEEEEGNGDGEVEEEGEGESDDNAE